MSINANSSLEDRLDFFFREVLTRWHGEVDDDDIRDLSRAALKAMKRPPTQDKTAKLEYDLALARTKRAARKRWLAAVRGGREACTFRWWLQQEAEQKKGARNG